MAEKRNAWHRGAEPGDYEFVGKDGDVWASVWRTTQRWAWDAYNERTDTQVRGIAETLHDAKAAAIAVMANEPLDTKSTAVVS